MTSPFAIGPILRGLVLVVWTKRHGDTIRITSARWPSNASKGSVAISWRIKDD